MSNRLTGHFWFQNVAEVQSQLATERKSLKSVPAHVWVIILDMMPSSQPQDHLNAALSCREAAAALLAMKTRWRAKFLAGLMDHYILGGLQPTRGKALEQDLLFVALFPNVDEESELVRSRLCEDADMHDHSPAGPPVIDEELVQQAARDQVLLHLSNWKKLALKVPKLPDTKAVNTVYEYFLGLHNMRPFFVLAGHLNRVEMDVKTGRLRRQIYKEVVDVDVDMLLWRHRDLIPSSIMDDIYRVSQPGTFNLNKYPRLTSVWKWWGAYPEP